MPHIIRFRIGNIGILAFLRCLCGGCCHRPVLALRRCCYRSRHIILFCRLISIDKVLVGIHDVAVGINGELTDTGKRKLGVLHQRAVFRRNRCNVTPIFFWRCEVQLDIRRFGHKEACAVDAGVETAHVTRRTGGHIRGNHTSHGTVTILGGVDAADRRRTVGRLTAAGTCRRGVQRILEGIILCLVAVGIDVGDIVTDDIQLVLMCAKSCYCRIHCF